MRAPPATRVEESMQRRSALAPKPVKQAGDTMWGLFFSHTESPVGPSPSRAGAWLQPLMHGIALASPSAALVWGITFTIAGSCLMAVGSVIMKQGIQKESERLQRDVTLPLKSYLWWLGIALYSVGAALHIVGLGFAPASVLAPLNALGLVANAAAAVVFLNETLSLVEAVCTLGTVIGVTLCAAASFLPHDDSYEVDGTESWQDPLYLVYVCLCGTVLLAFLILANHAEARLVDQQWEEAFQRHVDAGHIELTAMSTASGEPGQHNGLQKHAQHVPSKAFPHTRPRLATRPLFLMHPDHVGLLYGVVAGIVGAQCVLQLKEVAAFLKLGFHRCWTRPQPYFSTVFGVVSIFLQMHFLNLALARGDATLVIPTYYVFWTIVGTVGGFVKFHEIFGFTTLQIALFLLGLALTLISIAFMAAFDVQRLQSTVDHQSLASAPWGREHFQTRDQLAQPPTAGAMVPLAVGLGIIPIGRLSGRYRALPLDDASARPSRLRRTQSMAEISSRQRRYPGLDEIATQVSGPADTTVLDYNARSAKPTRVKNVPYTWTVAGAAAAPFLNGRRYLDVQSPRAGRTPKLGEMPGGHFGPTGRGEPQASFEGFDASAAFPRKAHQKRAEGASRKKSPLSHRRVQRPSKGYKKLSDIIFEEDAFHQSAYAMLTDISSEDSDQESFLFDGPPHWGDYDVEATPSTGSSLHVLTLSAVVGPIP